MATSGVSNFGVTTEINDLFLEAYERCGKGGEELGGYQLESARRSLSLLFTSWANNGPNLWAVDQQRFTLASGTKSYTLPTDTVAVLTAVVQRASGSTNIDYNIGAISRSEYAIISNKAMSATRPTSFYLERTQPPIMYVWPVPDNGDGTMIYWRMRMLQDPGAFTNTPDFPNRWMDAAAAGLAARLAVKVAPERVDMLKAEAVQAYNLAAGEDRERVPLRLQISVGG